MLWLLVFPISVVLWVIGSTVYSNYFERSKCDRCGREMLGKDLRSSSTTNWSGSSYRVTCKDHETCTNIWLGLK